MDDPDGHPIGLAPILLTDKEPFESVFRGLAQPISDYSFANTFIWSTCLKLYKLQTDRHVCVLANGTGDLTLLIPPMPEPGATDADLRDCLKTCFDVMDEYNQRLNAGVERSRIEYVSDELLARMTGLRNLPLNITPFSGDYVYDISAMIELGGNKLKSKRHARSKFTRDYPDHRVEDLTEQHVPACLNLLHLWQHHGDASHAGEITDQLVGSDVLRHRDSMACEMALRHFRQLGLVGMALMVGPQLIGFTLGEPIGSSQASILIEKTHPEFNGAAQYIFSAFCARYWSHLPECNVGDDWGIPSLRNVKASYRPIRRMAKHTVTLQRKLTVHIPAPVVVTTDASARV
jgi:hypothetical protein